MTTTDSDPPGAALILEYQIENCRELGRERGQPHHVSIQNLINVIISYWIFYQSGRFIKNMNKYIKMSISVSIGWSTGAAKAAQ